MKKCFLSLLSASLILVGGEHLYAQQRDTVAIVGKNYAITFGELQRFVHDNYYDLMYKYKPLEYGYKKALDRMIEQQLKRIDFFNLGLEKNDSLLQNAMRSINEALVAQYFERVFFEKYVNERSIHDAYEQMKKKIVFKRFLLIAVARDSAEAVDSVNVAGIRLQSELDRGKGFDYLVSDCRRWFPSAETKLDTGTVEWSQSVLSPAEEEIFNLRIGEVRVLRRATSLEIVKVIRVDPVPVKPFDEAREEIFDLLRARYMDKSIADYEKVKKGLIDTDRCEWNRKALEQLVTWSETKGFYESRLYVDTLSKAIADGRNFLILKYPGGKVDVKEFLRLLNNVLIPQQRSSYKVDDLKNYLLDAVRTDKLIRKAIALHLQRNLLNPNTTDPELKYTILRLYDEKEIEGKIPKLTEKETREFYEANKNSLYYQPALVIIDAIISSDKNLIDSLWQKYVLGTPFEKLASKWFVKSFARYRSEDTVRSYLSNEPPFLGKFAFSLKLNEVKGPIEYYDPSHGEQYAIIKCVERSPQKQLTLDEARKKIPDDFRKYEWTKINNETIARLKQKYGFKVYEAVLMRDLSSAK
jgi:parvulin-like peptidyl-prolyl isomerase